MHTAVSTASLRTIVLPGCMSPCACRARCRVTTESRRQQPLARSTEACASWAARRARQYKRVLEYPRRFWVHARSLANPIASTRVPFCIALQLTMMCCHTASTACSKVPLSTPTRSPSPSTRSKSSGLAVFCASAPRRSPGYSAPHLTVPGTTPGGCSRHPDPQGTLFWTVVMITARGRTPPWPRPGRTPPIWQNQDATASRRGVGTFSCSRMRATNG